MKKYCPYCVQTIDNHDSGFCPYCGKRLDVENEASELPVGTVLANRYWIGRRIGRGGFGITYVACDMRLGMKLAVKEYYPSAVTSRISKYNLDVTLATESDNLLFMQQKKSFVREAETLAGLASEVNIVRVCDIVSENNTCYIVMEYIDGVTLETYHQKKGNLSFKEAYQLIRPVIAVLQRVHDSGILHRDISPSNIMIGNNGIVKLLDFGSARDFDTNDIKSMTIVLKQGYAPPEQYYRHSEQGPWTDIYAVCATIYHLITGLVPQNSIERVLLDELKSPRELGANITENEEKVLLHGLSLDARQRIRSAGALLDAFDHTDRKPVYDDRSKDTIPRTQALSDHFAISYGQEKSGQIFNDRKSPSDVQRTKAEKPETGTVVLQNNEPAGNGYNYRFEAEQGKNNGNSSRKKLTVAIVAAALIAIMAAVGFYLKGNIGQTSADSNTLEANTQEAQTQTEEADDTSDTESQTAQHVHQWVDATCTSPKTCKTCHQTEGKPLGHSYAEATYDKPATCVRCGWTTGNVKGYVDAATLEKGSFSEDAVEIGNYNLYPWFFDNPLKNCRRIAIGYTIEEVVHGDPFGEFECYVHADGEWRLAGTFEVDKLFRIARETFTFDPPLTIDAIVYKPAGEIEETSWRDKFLFYSGQVQED